MTDCAALDFLLKKMMQLINSNDELILKAYRDKRLDKDQIEWLYEEMQLLREFLKDSEEERNEYEELNAIVANIRIITYRVEDIIDCFLLQLISQKRRIDAVRQREGRNFFVHFPVLVLSFHIIVVSYFLDVIYFAAFILILVLINWFITYACPYLIQVLTRKWHDFLFRKYLSEVMKEIKLIKTRVMEIYEKNMYGIGIIGVQQIGKISHHRLRKEYYWNAERVSGPNVEEEIVVGFDHQVEMLKGRLTGIAKQLQVISIVGMPGLGKTTLARKLYNDPFILYHFYIRGWTYVSQVYQKRDLLLGILCSVFGHKDQIFTESDENLGEELYKRLKGNRYLVVMDDVWHIGAWNDLKRYFPNDNNGSRILFTSRYTDVALLTKHDTPPHHLRFLNEDESWDLLQKKIFWKENCPAELMDIGKQIAKKCQGLPLAIVVVAGLLAKTDKIQNWWKQVAENLSSYIVSDTEQCMDILALSYNNLPYQLKSCFLYFGAFPEDYEISVRKLIWLWIAEGFIHRIGLESKSLEDVAEEYLMDLVGRNLVLVSKRKSTGRIRACRVHE